MKNRMNFNRIYLLLAYLALTALYLAFIPGDLPWPLRALGLGGLVLVIVLTHDPLLRAIEQVTGSLRGNDELSFFSAFTELSRKMHATLQTREVLSLVEATLKRKLRLRRAIILIDPAFLTDDAQGTPDQRGGAPDAPALVPWREPDSHYRFMDQPFLDAVIHQGEVFTLHDANPTLRAAFEETETGLAVPVLQKRRLLCLILIGGFDNARDYPDLEYRMFNFLANQLSIVLDRIRIYDQIMHQTAMDHAEKLQVMQSLSANIAHEMRTPLSGIRASITGIETYLPALIEGYQYAGERAPERFPAIRDNHLVTLRATPDRITLMIDQANAVIDMLLMNLRENSLDRNQLHACDAADCIEQALDRYPFKSGERNKVRADLADNFHFLGNETLFVYIMFNLLKNALYSIRSAQKGDILIRLETAGPFNRIRFRDTGLGVPREVRDRIFEGFFTTKSEGTGAGLAFCRRTVMGFGGSIECQSEPGEYAEFLLEFPVLRQVEPAAPPLAAGPARDVH